ncbi:MULTISPECIES: FAD-binding oxidoreductase [Nitrospirillum]|uniref:FAD/FMN-containing dehydrogenase n=1 Tax=Nitrospirillum amazonense TaxID=28077 RepID=A0A560FXA2_9PROT|nr:FAD-binding oxidoreductase [Nitrospirillum amazonense]MEC4590446.1 FAD-binding oxidoreductase [Nitrospirillum amazonense]TWB26263.1 FAD/FMN-containing dehydrogenase [Nitrospirillum amazonense]
MRQPITSWGNLASVEHDVATPAFREDAAPLLSILAEKTGSVLAHGLGRSYGDSPLNAGGGLLVTRRMDRCHAFDTATGVLRADAGLSLADLHVITVPRGWFVAVTPGTKFITLGGAVANDVHGKNHHVAGSFGHHVRAFGMRRSDGTLVDCAPDRNTDLFRATIGGLGLTGLIEWVEIQLQAIASSDMEVENIRFDHVDRFFDLAAESLDWPYSVAWVDCLSQGASLGRGIFSRGRHAPDGPRLAQPARAKLAVPLTPPISLINGLSLRAFNAAYYSRPGATFAGRCHFDGFFYPLDGVHHWNRVYGPRGFYQYQCVVPPAVAREAVTELLARIAASGTGSCLVVLKNFGDVAPAGLLSFPMAGTTLALDFPNQGQRTLALMADLDRTVAAAGGRLYPAKDARMPAGLFAAGYPAVADFKRHIDPAFMSDFWRRMEQAPTKSEQA